MRLIALACLLPLYAAGADPWLRVRSAHFELFTTAGERSGRELTRYLEQVRSFFLQAFDVAGQPGRPVRVISFRSEREYRPYQPSEVADAFFRPGADHDYIVMKYSTGDLYATAVHEYAHLLLRQTRMEIPQWLNEGLAELYSNLQPTGSRIIVGRPIPARMEALARERWIDLRTLLGPGQLGTDKGRAAMFYAESWALLHMLSLDARYSSRLKNLLTAMQGGDAAAAFQRIYGKSLEQVQADLWAYVRADSIATAAFDVRESGAGEAPKIETNASMAARLALAELLSNDRRTVPQAVAAYESVARDFENRWEVEQAWAEFCVRERRNAEAMRHFARAAGLGCEDPRMFVAYARLLNLSDRSKDAVDNLRTALRLDPESDEAHFELAVALVKGGESGEAIAEFHRIRQLAPAHAYRYYYHLAQAHAQAGDRAQARKLIQRAMGETRNPEERAALERLLLSVR